MVHNRLYKNPFLLVTTLYLTSCQVRLTSKLRLQRITGERRRKAGVWVNEEDRDVNTPLLTCIVCSLTYTCIPKKLNSSKIILPYLLL